MKRKIKTAPTKIHKYHLLINAHIAGKAPEDETAAGAPCPGTKSTVTESEWGAPAMLAVAVACFAASVEMSFVLPSKVIVFALMGGKEPMFMPETMSPESGTLSILTFPKEAISLGILAETLTLSICEVPLFAKEIIK